MSDFITGLCCLALNIAAGVAGIWLLRAKEKMMIKLMWPRVSFEFRGGSTTPLNSTLSESIGVWYRCLKYHGRAYLRLKHVEVCFSFRSDGRTWNWHRIF